MNKAGRGMDDPAFEWAPVPEPAGASDRSLERVLVVTGQTQQDALRSQVKSLLRSQQMKACGTLDLSYTLRDTAFIYLLLTGAVGGMCSLHASWGPVTLAAAPLFALLAGVGFNWINVQIHEASHCLLLRNKRWNDLYCNLVFGAIGLQDVQTYRATHRMHHAYLHTQRDPDLWIYTANVGSFRQVARGILDDLCLRTLLRRKQQVAEFIRVTGMSRGRQPRYARFAKLLAQSLLLGVFVWGCGIWGVAYYAAVYVYGLLGVFPVLVRIRTVVQHFDSSLLAPKEGNTFPFVSRSTVAPVVEFILVGARMDYHFEHHIYPNLPYYGLKKMHRALQAAGFFESVHASAGQSLHTDDYLRTYLSLSLKGA
jgi:fatty acid desaturase